MMARLETEIVQEALQRDGAECRQAQGEQYSACLCGRWGK